MSNNYNQEKTLLQHAQESVTINFANFEGRARRREYWGTQLFLLLVTIVASFLSTGLAIVTEVTGFVFLGYLPLLFAIIPILAVSVRRLHDTGRSGWWLLISLVPFGGIVLFVFYLTEGQPHDNEYGPNPKA